MPLVRSHPAPFAVLLACLGCVVALFLLTRPAYRPHPAAPAHEAPARAHR